MIQNYAKIKHKLTSKASSSYYDVRGYYHKVCDKNIINYKDIKDGFYKEFGKKKPPPPNVWQ